MEPIHIYALQKLNQPPEVHRERLERYFVARDRARATRRRRIQRWRRRLLGHGAPQPVEVQLAAP